jgi:peroxiredoxin
MRGLTSALIAIAFTLNAGAQTGGPSPDAQYRSLLSEYNASLIKARDAVKAAKTEAEKKEARSSYPTVEVIGPRFMALAKKYPRTSVACESLVWIVGRSRQEFDVFPARVEIMRESMEILARDFVDDLRVGQVCINLTRYPSSLRDRFLRTLYEKTNSRDVRGCACLYLARYLVSKAKAAETARNTRLGERRDTMQLTPDSYFEELRSTDPMLLAWEADALFEKTIREYGDLRNPPGSKLTFAQLAEADLKALREIGAGKAAPDIAGADINGNTFKLSDYRGKVVVLSFSGSWCAPCRAQYPHHRELVSRLKERPFALLSVNTDEKETLRKAIGSGEITWKCWWDGGMLGPICKAWNVYGFPTFFVIDASGVIRRRNVKGATLDEVVDGLLAETNSPTKG